MGKLVKMRLKRPEENTINFNHAVLDLTHSPSVRIPTFCSSQQGNLGKGGHYGSTRSDERCKIQVQEPTGRQVMDPKKAYEG